MTLEELWELFPIVLVPHDPRWKDWAAEEIASLGKLLSDFNPVSHHIGSTAIPNIHAKPIIDILVEIPDNVDWSDVKEVMEAQGYICMSETESRISFNKGYTPEGYAEKVYHIHFHRLGDNDEIMFLDFLLAHSYAAKAYERLKLSLLSEYRHDRDGYTDAKTEFIKGTISKAKQSQSEDRYQLHQ